QLAYAAVPTPLTPTLPQPYYSFLLICPARSPSFSFFFNDPAPPEIYTLSLHTLFRSSASGVCASAAASSAAVRRRSCLRAAWIRDRKSTRLNSSHQIISYAVFCLKKKKKIRVLS